MNLEEALAKIASLEDEIEKMKLRAENGVAAMPRSDVAGLEKNELGLFNIQMWPDGDKWRWRIGAAMAGVLTMAGPGVDWLFSEIHGHSPTPERARGISWFLATKMTRLILRIDEEWKGWDSE